MPNTVFRSATLFNLKLSNVSRESTIFRTDDPLWDTETSANFYQDIWHRDPEDYNNAFSSEKSMLQLVHLSRTAQPSSPSSCFQAQMCTLAQDSRLVHISRRNVFWLYLWPNKKKTTRYVLLKSGTVGWGTALQGGRSRVRFPKVSLDYGLGSTQSLTEMSTRNISWGVKAAGA
jgi:hypothetical protein